MSFLIAYRIFAGTMLLAFIALWWLIEDGSRRVNKEIQDLEAPDACEGAVRHGFLSSNSLNRDLDQLQALVIQRPTHPATLRDKS